MGILEDLRDGKPCRWTGVCDEMSAVGGCTCGEAADEIERLREALKSISKIPNSESAYGIIQTFVDDALKGKE
jgi:hypothetical protein